MTELFVTALNIVPFGLNPLIYVAVFNCIILMALAIKNSTVRTNKLLKSLAMLALSTEHVIASAARQSQYLEETTNFISFMNSI